jgi:hypothetical protein
MICKATFTDIRTDKAHAYHLAEKGWGVIPPEQFRIDMEAHFFDVWEKVRPFTMTSLERGYALYKAVQHIAVRRLEGALVECGVWRGGSCMLMAHTLLQYEALRPYMYLYDTFCGMTEPGEKDRIAWNGESVLERWKRSGSGVNDDFTSWSVSYEEVYNNLLRTAYPEERLIFVRGDVQETLKETVPDKIALLRLDTDWYESTLMELEVLYPKLVNGGILIIDDYGHFTGARKAVDEYFTGHKNPVLFNRIDYTGRIGVKVITPD